MAIILFNDACLYNNNKTIIYGQYSRKFTSIKINLKLSYKFVLCKKRPDFYIEIDGKINNINEITFMKDDNIQLFKKQIVLHFPFENCDLSLNPKFKLYSIHSSNLDE